MRNNNHEEIQNDTEKKAALKIKRKTLSMKMSGKQIKNLQKIIIENANKRGKKSS